jgi:endonuclease G
MQNDSGGLTISLPLELTIRFGDGVTRSAVITPHAAGVGGPLLHDATPTPSLSSPLPAQTLRAGAEAVVIDKDYSNREGYNATFIAGVELPIPTPNETARIKLLTIDDGTTELKYTHYSVVLNATNKMALLTATNLDGNTFLKVNRTTGRVADDAEGESWAVDPRVPPAAVPGQDFYSRWTTYFDRGHLTRREDTNWGATNEESERGNADTFHFTNCTPQHFRFNESTKYWQGVERYVLENGTERDGNQNKLCIFQGPIFSKNDRFADKVQVPSRFFKVVVWKGHDRNLKSVSFIVDQSSLLDEKRVGLGKPRDNVKIDVQQYRVQLTEVETETGLVFDEAIRNADTFELKQAPEAGEGFSAISLRSESDILPASARRSAAPPPP